MAIYDSAMSYNEPPEWAGRGPRDRSGWPNESANPGVPRSHRRVGEERVRIAEEPDTGEFRPSRESFGPDMPTEELDRGAAEAEYRRAASEGQPTVIPGPVRQRPVLRPHFVLEREPDAVYRVYLWLGVAVRVLAIIALACGIFVLGMCIADKGVPLWVPGS